MWFFINLVFIFTLIIIVLYVLLGIFSSLALRTYLRKNSYVDYNMVADSPLSPSVSIIAPAFNEEKSIVNNVKTLLALHYRNYEVMVVNDGSTDNTFKLIKENFDLVKVDYFFSYRIKCAEIRGIYKSTNPAFRRLTVVDKENAGNKSDAINAGLNICKNDLLVTIDADSIIEPDALSKLVKPFLEEKDKKVIGTGGVIRVLNSCEVENGKVKQVNLPKKFLPRLQVLEYTRAFLLGRMAWSKLDGLMLISGAMGMFDRETMIKVGGYDSSVIGEDMEVVLRMRKYMADQKKKYIVTYIPDPLCWTEVPEDLKSLQQQRTRWTRGLIDSLVKHKDIFFNSKYGKLGMLGYPFWFIFEWLAPLAAFSGILYTIFLIIVGSMNWSFFLLLTAFIYSFSIALSTWSVLFEEITFHKYRRKRDVVRLVLTSFIEPFMYIILAWFSVKGNIQHIFKKGGWGTIKRNGNK
jgi:biofilm PGA synthesis N-glycosyltransferase PgaC